VWTPDGRQIIYAADTSEHVLNLFRIVADGNGTPEQLTKGSQDQYPCAVTPDGDVVMFAAVENEGQLALTMMPLGSREPRVIVHATVPGAASYADRCGSVSPNGKFIAYVSSTETGQNEIFVRPLVSPAGQWQISTEGGGFSPIWSADGKELFYRRFGVGMMAASVDTGPSFAHGASHLLFPSPSPVRSIFSVTRDSQRFLLTEGHALSDAPGGFDQTPAGSVASIVVTLNWLDELKSAAAKVK
jgi:Tol biopolymer transport system component